MALTFKIQAATSPMNFSKENGLPPPYKTIGGAPRNSGAQNLNNGQNHSVAPSPKIKSNTNSNITKFMSPSTWAPAGG